MTIAAARRHKSQQHLTSGFDVRIEPAILTGAQRRRRKGSATRRQIVLRCASPARIAKLC
ncbi:MAG: hypothetical protein WC689_15605 [Methylocystis sp.]